MVDYKVIPSSTSVRKQRASLGWSAVCPPGPRAPLELAARAPFIMWYKPQELGGYEGELDVRLRVKTLPYQEWPGDTSRLSRVSLKF